MLRVRSVRQKTRIEEIKLKLKIKGTKFSAQCSCCNPVGDNITWPRIKLQKNKLIFYNHAKACMNCTITNYTSFFVTIMPRNMIYASGKIVKRIQVHFVTFRKYIDLCYFSCPGHLFFCNGIVGKVTLSPIGSHLLQWSLAIQYCCINFVVFKLYKFNILLCIL